VFGLAGGCPFRGRVGRRQPRLERGLALRALGLLALPLEPALLLDSPLAVPLPDRLLSVLAWHL